MSVSVKTSDFFEGYLLDALSEKLKKEVNFDPAKVNHRFVSTIRFDEDDREEVLKDLVTFIESDKEVVYSMHIVPSPGRDSFKYVLRLGDDIFFTNIHIDDSEATISVFCNKALGFQEQVETFIKSHEEDEEEDGEDEGIIINYIYNNDHSVNMRKRTVKFNSLDSIRSNYSATSYAALLGLRDRLITGVDDCKVAFLSGLTGTGKTYALQGLMHDLSDKYQIIVIYDAVKFLTDLSLYEEITSSIITDPSLYIFDDVNFADLNQFKSNLTALVGGLFAADRGDVFLFTSDNQFSQLEQSMYRHGRCIGRIELMPLSVEEIDNWLIENNLEKPRKIKGNLAELYAYKDGLPIVELGRALTLHP